MVSILIILGLSSVRCWWLVFNKRARDSRPAKDFFRLSDDDEKMLEASGFAAALIGALFFTIFLIAFLVMRIRDWM